MSDTKTVEPVAARIVEDTRGNATAILPKEIAETVDNGEVGGGTNIETSVVERREERRAGRDPEDRDDDDRDTSGGGRSDYNSNRNRLKRERRKRAQERDKGHINELTQIVVSQGQMLRALTQGQQRTAISILEREAGDARAAYAEAQRRHKEAIDKGDGAVATEAQTVMNNATNYYNNVVRQHTQLVEQLKRTETDDDGSGDAPPARVNGNGDARPKFTRAQVEKIEDLREDFLEAHPYVDVTEGSPMQTAIKAIDAEIAADGFKPYTQDYWDELSERLKEAGLDRQQRGRSMRNRNDDDDDEPRRRAADGDPDDPDYDLRQRGRAHRRREYRERDDDSGGPPTGGAGRGGGGRDVEVRLTPEMRKGLADSGIPEAGGDASMVRRRNRILAAYSQIPSRR